MTDAKLERPAAANAIMAMRAVTSILKRRFNSLTAEEVLELAGDIVIAIDITYYGGVER